MAAFSSRAEGSRKKLSIQPLPTSRKRRSHALLLRNSVHPSQARSGRCSVRRRRLFAAACPMKSSGSTGYRRTRAFANQARPRRRCVWGTCSGSPQALSVELRAPGEEVFHDFQILNGEARPKPEHFCADRCVHRLAIRKYPLRNAYDLFSPIARIWLAHGVPSLYKAIDQGSGRSGCQARGLRQFPCRASAASRVEKMKACPLGSLQGEMVGYHLSCQHDLFTDSS
jgi:hypothetical protein